MTNFHGLATLRLQNEQLSLDVLANAPRIVRLQPRNHPNLFADLEDFSVPTPHGDFYFHGGHRLWHAPEAMPRTYIPEAHNARHTLLENGVRLEQPAEPWTHIAKTLEIRLHPTLAQVEVVHELRNEGAWAVELAPWALSMFRLGGTAIFPQPHEKTDSAGLLPNRQIALWQYTRVDDSRLSLRDDYILIHATPSLPPVKIGYFNPAAWMAYHIEGVLFVKRFSTTTPGAPFPDGGCNTESFCNHQFVELESLGALTKLQPGASVTHTEHWEVFETLNQPFLSASLQEMLASW
jgi:hypothetical protein